MKHAGCWLMGGLFLSVSLTVTAATRCVNVNSLAPALPYTTWETAATNIQDAVDAAVAGDLVLVTSGVYQTGGWVVYGSMTNRVAVTKPLTLQSVNGPGVTIIEGYQVPVATNSDGAIRCVYLASGVVLSGFTLTNGATRTDGDPFKEQSGGGVWCESASATVTNCVLSGNSASSYGGGAYYGTLNNCTLSGNSAELCGGGAYSGTLNNCTLSGNSADSGGGAYDGTLNNCALSGNRANYAGGAYLGTLNNCTLSGNSANWGGGAYFGTLNNCTLSGNSANSGGGVGSGTLNNCMLNGNSAHSSGGGASDSKLDNCTVSGNLAYYGGGVSGGTLNNCIIYYNRAPQGANFYEGTLNYCCTTPMPSDGTGNRVVEPELASGSHLSAGSPCRGAGSAAYSTGVDIDG